MQNINSAPPALFAPLTEACAANGIPRTLGFELARTGVLETVKIGRRRYVVLSSLRSLPERLAKQRTTS